MSVLCLVCFPLLWGVFLFRQKQETLWNYSVLGASALLLLSLWATATGDRSLVILPLFSHFGIGFQGQSFALLYSVLSCGLFLCSILCSKDYFQGQTKWQNRYYASLFLTLSGCLGMFFAEDLFTLFIFFELMSFSSYLWVLHKQDIASLNASHTYLIFTVLGGMSVLLGIFLLWGQGGELSLSQLPMVFVNQKTAENAQLASFFLFFGFGAKAGVFLVHDWLPPSYTASPAPATGLLSGVLTKSALYGILIVAWRVMEFLPSFSMFIVVMGLCNMSFGAVCGFLSGNLKRTLAFSSISQMGFMLWGVGYSNLLGSHNSVAVYGTFFHMINHSVLKVLLFSLSGIVLCKAGTLELEELRGFGKGKRWFQALFGFASVSLGGVPLGCVYVSKTLLHESVVEYLHFHPEAGYFFQISEWIFLISGGFTVAYLLKLYWCLFLEEGEWDKSPYASDVTLGSLTALCGVLFVLGVVPSLSFNALGDYVANFFETELLGDLDYFSFANLQGTMISLVIGCGVFFHNKMMMKNNQKLEYQERLNPEDTFVCKLYLPLLKALELTASVVMRCFDLFLETIMQHCSQRYFKSLIIPETFYFGEEFLEKRKPLEVKVTQSLAYSLLMFGLGFIFTIVYLLVVGGTLS